MTFIERMTNHWRHNLGLANSKALADGWLQLERAAKEVTKGAEHWQVLQLPTGTGKTEALKVLCSLQDPIRHAGTLIVTKFREEADNIASGINQLSGGRLAISLHTEAPTQSADVGFTPVLVITHAAYRLALQELANTGTSRRAEQYFVQLGGIADIRDLSAQFRHSRQSKGG